MKARFTEKALTFPGAGEKNLVPDGAHESIRSRLAARLAEWMESTGDFLPGPMPDPPPEQLL